MFPGLRFQNCGAAGAGMILSLYLFFTVVVVASGAYIKCYLRCYWRLLFSSCSCVECMYSYQFRSCNNFRNALSSSWLDFAREDHEGS